MATKHKTHKSTVKRFRVTATGKLIHRPQDHGNNSMTKKSSQRRNRIKKDSVLSSAKQTRLLKKLANY